MESILAHLNSGTATTAGLAIASFLGGLGVYFKMRKDIRSDAEGATVGQGYEQLITQLRNEIARLSKHVDECEKKSAELLAEVANLKKQNLDQELRIRQCEVLLNPPSETSTKEL